jgi:hypothetical protein
MKLRRDSMEKMLGKRKNTLIRSMCMLTVGVSFISLVACAAEQPRSVVPAVSPVNVVDATVSNPLYSPAHCPLRGQVLVRTVDRFKPNTLAMTQEEMMELQDKALQLNANSVVIRHNQVIYQNGMYVHVINSDAYACAPTLY